MIAKGSPEWLPAGWTVAYRVQKTGRKIRFYKHLETGKSFVSKDEVIQFVRSSLNQKPLPTAENRKSRDFSVQPLVETNEHPSWLPDGWNVEMKTRMSGRTVGSSYKCYIDPVSGNKFYSKPEVLRYLRTLKPESRTFKRKEKNTAKSKVEQSKEADLPQGWIRKTKITKNAHGTRRDSFYTDPVTGYTFRSRLEVFRYLKTGNINRYAIKSKKRNSTDQPFINNDKTSSVVKRQKTEKKPARQPVTTGNVKCEKGSEEILEDKRTRTEDGEAMFPKKSNASTTAVDRKRRNSKNKKPKDETRPCRSSKRLAGKEPEFMPRVSDGDGVKLVTLPDLNLNSDSCADKQNEELVVNPVAKGGDRGFDETNGASNVNLDKSCETEEQSTSQVVETEKIRESEEQFSVPIADFLSDPCLEFAIKTLTGALPVVGAANNGPESTLIGRIQTETRIDKRSRGNPKTVKNKKELCLPRQSSTRTAGCKNKVKPVKGPACVSSTVNGDTTILGEAFKKSEKPNENQAILNANHHGTAESISSYPFGFSWSDPCLDFAFKTLTGSIPVDDSLGIHTFFRENLESAHSQRDSTITLPDFGSTSYLQSDNVSSQIDPAGNSGTISSFLPMGNVGLPGFGTLRQAHIKGDKVSKGK